MIWFKYDSTFIMQLQHVVYMYVCMYAWNWSYYAIILIIIIWYIHTKNKRNNKKKIALFFFFSNEKSKFIYKNSIRYRNFLKLHEEKNKIHTLKKFTQNTKFYLNYTTFVFFFVFIFFILIFYSQNKNK